MSPQEQLIIDRRIKGLTWRLIGAAFVFFGSVEATILGVYWGNDKHNTIQDIQIQSNSQRIQKVEAVQNSFLANKIFQDEKH